MSDKAARSDDKVATPTSDELAVEGFFDKEIYTPYQLSTKVNEVLAALGLNKTLPPQMFYQYVKNGLIRSAELEIKADERERPRGTKRVVIKAEAVKWLIKYLDHNFKNDWRVLSKAGL